tara:strand:- start:143 stop:949 length:807 start_codon:yes stop_codon:yes gene_type:complete
MNKLKNKLMRKKTSTWILPLLIVCFTITSCSAKEKELSYKEISTIDTDSIPLNIQSKIEEGLNKTFMKRNVKALDSVFSSIEKDKSPIAEYWKAYILYNKSIFYLSSRNKEKSEQALEEGIKLLKEASKSSESYALLGTMQNFSIQFKNGITAGILGSKAKKNFEKALKLEPNNLRAYLGLATLDYYTPEKYGGRKEAAKYIEKALACPDKPLPSPVLPSWGRKSCYEIIINFYIFKEDKVKAKKYYQEAIKLYPKDYQISMLAKKLI